MKNFLAKFLSQEEIATIVEKYKEKNPGAADLPEYISKKRLDEVIGERENAKNALKAIPENWKKQLEDAQSQAKAHEEAKKAIEAEFAAFKESSKAEQDLIGKLYAAKAKNHIAVRALIDKTKPVDEEIARLQKEEPYLFGSTGSSKPPKGTDKDGGDDDDTGSKGGFDLEAARAALGLPTTETK